MTAICGLLLTFAGVGCDEERGVDATQRAPIAIDGSSTLLPITEAVAREFHKRHKPRILVSGTGGGLDKLCRREVLISGASRPINLAEMRACAERGVELIELPVAFDGIAMVVHSSNDWVDHLSVSELKAMWEPAAQEKITRWSQVRSGWPDRVLHLFGPGQASGTYDYFTEAMVGQEHASRADFRASEDDEVLARDIASDPAALGFFGYAYYIEHAKSLRLVPIDAERGKGPIVPTHDTIAAGTYQPLTRPLFIYVSVEGAKRPAVADFVTFYLEQAPTLAPEVGYVPLPKRAYELARARFDARTTGSRFGGDGAKVGVTPAHFLVAP